jgi:hypothetical protein
MWECLLIIGAGVEFDGDDGRRIIGVSIQQGLGIRYGNDAHFSVSRRGFLDGAAGMSHRVKECIDAAVLKKSRRFRRLDLLGVKVFFVINTRCRECVNGVLPLSGTGISDVDPFAPQVIDGLYAGILGCHQGDGFRMDAEDGPQLFLGPGFFPFRQAVERPDTGGPTAQCRNRGPPP